MYRKHTASVPMGPRLLGHGSGQRMDGSATVNEPDAQHSGSRWEPPAGAAPTAPVPAADPGYRTAELPQSGQPGHTAVLHPATAAQEMPAAGTSRRLPGRLRRRVAT